MPNSAMHLPKRTNAMPKLRVRLLLPLSAMIVALSACRDSPTEPRLDPTGQWVGTVSGVRVRLDLTEHYVTELGWSSYVLRGTGSITIVATGDSLPFVADGSRTSSRGPKDVVVHFLTPDKQHYYGHFWGQVNSAGSALAGVIDGSIPNTIGPFQGEALPDWPITLTRP